MCVCVCVCVCILFPTGSEEWKFHHGIGAYMSSKAPRVLEKQVLFTFIHSSNKFELSSYMARRCFRQTAFEHLCPTGDCTLVEGTRSLVDIVSHVIR